MNTDNRYFIQISKQDDDDQKEGTFWHSIDGINLTMRLITDKYSQRNIITNKTVFDANKHYEIDEEIFRLLLDTNPLVRYNLFKEKLFDILKTIQLESYVLINSCGNTKNITGTVKCKLSISYDKDDKTIEKAGTDIWQHYIFGIILDEKFAGKGPLNGTYNGKTYFVCAEDCAAFQGAYKLMPLHIKVNDEVIWIDENESEYPAIVRWVGLLPGRKHVYAGVEFEKPIGSGTGKYEGEQLFEVKPRHASFIPLSGLYKKELNENNNSIDNGKTSVIDPCSNSFIQPQAKRID